MHERHRAAAQLLAQPGQPLPRALDDVGHPGQEHVAGFLLIGRPEGRQRLCRHGPDGAVEGGHPGDRLLLRPVPPGGVQVGDLRHELLGLFQGGAGKLVANLAPPVKVLEQDHALARLLDVDVVGLWRGHGADAALDLVEEARLALVHLVLERERQVHLDRCGELRHNRRRRARTRAVIGEGQPRERTEEAEAFADRRRLDRGNTLVLKRATGAQGVGRPVGREVLVGQWNGQVRHGAPSSGAS